MESLKKQVVKYKIIHIPLPAETHAQLKEIALENDLKMTQQGRYFIKRGIVNYNKVNNE